MLELAVVVAVVVVLVVVAAVVVVAGAGGTGAITFIFIVYKVSSFTRALASESPKVTV